MKPTLIISDIHGSTRWKEFVSRRRPGERVVFLGDYFDRRGRGPFASDDATNFLEIGDYARRYPDTILLVGNHDYQYATFAPWTPKPWGERERRNREALMSAIDSLAMVFVDRSGEKPVIFSHGGLTATFMALHGVREPEAINDLWIERPQVFDWLKRDPVSGVESDLAGDDVWQSPIWARDMALLEDAVAGYDQIVGHTPVLEPEWYATARGDSFMMTCTLDDTLVRLP